MTDSLKFSIRELKLDSAFLITLVTSTFYFFGYYYYKAFYEQLLIPNFAGDLPLYQYVIKSINIIISAFILFSVYSIFSLPEIKHKYNNFVYKKFLVPILQIFLLFSVYIFLSIPEYIMYPWLFLIKMLLIFTFLVGLILFIEWKMASYKNKINNTNSIRKIGFLIGIVIAGCFVSYIYGNISANNFIQGSDPEALQIRIFLKDKNNTQIENRTFILTGFNNDKYYIIEKNKKPAKLYILSSDQIELIVIEKRGQGFPIYIYNELRSILKKNESLPDKTPRNT